MELRACASVVVAQLAQSFDDPTDDLGGVLDLEAIMYIANTLHDTMNPVW